MNGGHLLHISSKYSSYNSRHGESPCEIAANESVKLPYKPLDASLMIPVKWTKQEHEQCEDIYDGVKGSADEPMSSIIYSGMEDEKVERDGVISELY